MVIFDIIFRGGDKMKGYEKAAEYWNRFFEGTPEYDPSEKINEDSLEKALEWVSSEGGAIVDYGCGHGKLLVRSLDLGVGRIYGIDISKKAITRAKRIVKRAGFEKRAVFTAGGLDKLRALGEDTFDGGILTGILDNLTPEDGAELLKLTHRVVKPGGRVLLMINPHLEESFAEKIGLKRKSEDFYEDEDGLFLWNLSNEKIEKITEPYFTVVNRDEIDLGNGLSNRLFRLVNR